MHMLYFERRTDILKRRTVKMAAHEEFLVHCLNGSVTKSGRTILLKIIFLESSITTPSKNNWYYVARQ